MLPLQNPPRKNGPNLVWPPFYDTKIFVAIEMRLENLNPVGCLLTRFPSPRYRNGDGLLQLGKNTCLGKFYMMFLGVYVSFWFHVRFVQLFCVDIYPP